MSILPAVGTRIVDTSGQPDRTSAHSTGLSSRNIKLSRPRPSSRAIDRIFSDLSCQLIRHATRSSRFRIMSGCRSRTARTLDSAFLLFRHNRNPSAANPTMNCCSALQRGGDRDSLYAILANHAVPEGVVAVHHDHLVGGASKGMNSPRQQCPECREERRRVGDMADVVALRVMIVGDRVQIEVVRTDNTQPGNRPQLRDEPRGDPVAEFTVPRASPDRGRRSVAPTTGWSPPSPRRSGRPHFASRKLQGLQGPRPRVEPESNLPGAPGPR